MLGLEEHTGRLSTRDLKPPTPIERQTKIITLVDSNQKRTHASGVPKEICLYLSMESKIKIEQPIRTS